MKKESNTKDKTDKKQGKAKKPGMFGSMKNFFTDERFTVSLGILLIAFSILLTLSFTSYLFTWKSDQSILDIPLNKLFSNESLKVDNWVGKIGALLSNLFIRNWFGLASF